MYPSSRWWSQHLELVFHTIPHHVSYIFHNWTFTFPKLSNSKDKNKSIYKKEKQFSSRQFYPIFNNSSSFSPKSSSSRPSHPSPGVQAGRVKSFSRRCTKNPSNSSRVTWVKHRRRFFSREVHGKIHGICFLFGDLAPWEVMDFEEKKSVIFHGI